MATTQEQIDQQAKDFAEAWPTEDVNAAPTPPEKNPNAFYTHEEKTQMDAEAARAAKKA